MNIGFGCVNLGSASSTTTWREQLALVRSAIDSGVTHFDTADVYGNGTSERILGRAVRNRRSEVTLSTKGGYVFRPRSTPEQRARRAIDRLRRSWPQISPGPSSGGAAGSYRAQDFSPARLRIALEASLRRMRTDHVDVYQLHGPPNVVPELLEELSDLRCAGMVRRFGVGAESVASAAAWTSEGVDVIQLPFGVLDPDASSEVFDSARARQIQVWARGVLGGGLLTQVSGDPRSVANHPKSDLIAALLGIARDAGMAIDELAVRWVGRHRDVATMLVGISSTAHLHRNVWLASMPPLPDDVAALIAALFDDTADRTGPS